MTLEVALVHRYMAAQIREREGFVLVSEPECSNVCFFHVPLALRADPIAQKMLATEPVGYTLTMPIAIGTNYTHLSRSRTCTPN